jgi:hypothetical protein
LGQNLRVLIALLVNMFCGTLACSAGDVRLAKELTFNNEAFATRPNDALTYVVIGGGWLRGIRSEDPAKFISAWLAEHPAASVKPISRMVLSRAGAGGQDEQLEYIWIEEGKESLNVDLVRAGIYPAPAMADMVDFRKQLDEILKEPSIAAEIIELQKRHPEEPEALPKPERLISDKDYKQRMQRVAAAADHARKRKLGVWSDAMKEERDALVGP